MGHGHSIGCLNDLPAHLSTFLRARDIRDKFPGLHDANLSIDKAIESAIRLGLPALRDEADVFSSPVKGGGRPCPLCLEMIQIVYFSDAPFLQGE